jgi:hypothetical protein
MSLDVLRAHYGMLATNGEIGTMPDPKPSSIKFEAAFAAALETNERWSFCQMPPLLIINSWDAVYLLRATPAASRGRLRFLASLALFFIEFDETAMPWPVKTAARLESLLNGLAPYNMDGDPFRDFLLPVCGPLSFFHPHKLDTDWKLGGLWRCWTSSRRENRELLSLFAEACPEEPTWATDGVLDGQLDAIMELPFDQRIRELKEFIKLYPKPQDPPEEDPSGLPPF